jgi:hypothetical protein
MGSSWKRSDLGGEGLQAVNLRLARVLRKRRVAYALWLAFPLGAHRWYLRERYGALAYIALTVMAFAFPWVAFGSAALALFDLWWIDRRVTRLNKRLRMQIALQGGAGVGGKLP